MNLPVCLSLASLDLLLQKIFVERCWSQICQKMGREMHPHQTRSNLDCTIFIKNYTKTYRRVMKRNKQVCITIFIINFKWLFMKLVKIDAFKR